MGGFVPGEVKIFSRIKLPPPLHRSRDFPRAGDLKMAGDLEKKAVLPTVWMGRKKNFPRWREILVSWVEKEMKIV